MALRPLLLSLVVGIAAIGAFHTPAAKASGYVSINVGTPTPRYRSNYGSHYDGRHVVRHDHRYDQSYRVDHRDGRHHRPGYTFVPGHWAHGQRGRVWVPDQYVRVHSGHGRGYEGGHGYDSRVIYPRALTPRPLPGAFYQQRGG